MLIAIRTDGTEAEYNGERTVEGISKCKSLSQFLFVVKC